MNIVYITEENNPETIEGTNYEIYDKIVEITLKEKHNSGFVGAIDHKGKLRGTLSFHVYRGKFRTVLFDFIRKYKAVEALETLAESLREKVNNEK